MKNPTKFHSTSLAFGPSMVGLFHAAKIRLFPKPARGGAKIFFFQGVTGSLPRCLLNDGKASPRHPTFAYPKHPGLRSVRPMVY